MSSPLVSNNSRYQIPNIQDVREDKPDKPGIAKYQFNFIGWIVSKIRLSFKDETTGYWLNKQSAILYINRHQALAGLTSNISTKTSKKTVQAYLNTIRQHSSPSAPTTPSDSLTTISTPSVTSASTPPITSPPVFFPELTREQVQKLSDRILGDQCENTGMTNLLATFAFSNGPIYQANKTELDNYLKELVELSKNNPAAKKALITPNAEGKSFDDALLYVGYPQNTPLHLLVKMGNLEGATAILPIYEKRDLLATTPGKNTALHLAFTTGQTTLAFRLMQRARELNCLDELLNAKNAANLTAAEIFSKFATKNVFRPGDYLNFADECLNHEEINKALCKKSFANFMHVRMKFAEQLQELFPKDKMKELINTPLIDLIDRNSSVI